MESLLRREVPSGQEAVYHILCCTLSLEQAFDYTQELTIRLTSLPKRYGVVGHFEFTLGLPLNYHIGIGFTNGTNSIHKLTVFQLSIIFLIIAFEENINISSLRNHCSDENQLLCELFWRARSLTLFVKDAEGVHQVEIRAQGELHLY